MSQANQQKKTEDSSSKVISALVTQVKNLEHKLNSKPSTLLTEKGNYKLKLPVWRTKKEGDKVNQEGKTWWWYPHHKKEGLFDGLYMPHKPSEHDDWICKKKEQYSKYKKKENSGTGTTNLTLTDS